MCPFALADLRSASGLAYRLGPSAIFSLGGGHLPDQSATPAWQELHCDGCDREQEGGTSPPMRPGTLVCAWNSFFSRSIGVSSGLAFPSSRS
jgi:hypothetical protein